MSYDLFLYVTWSSVSRDLACVSCVCVSRIAPDHVAKSQRKHNPHSHTASGNIQNPIMNKLKLTQTPVSETGNWNRIVVRASYSAREERREDARVWAATELRRLAGVSEAVVEARLQRQRGEYEERLRVGSRRGDLAAAGGGGGSSGGTGQLETQIKGSRGGRHSTARQRGRGGSSGEGRQRGRL